MDTPRRLSVRTACDRRRSRTPRKAVTPPEVRPSSAPPTTVTVEVVIAGDECLNLNIWTPDLTAAGLPVLVWIHCGSFMNGSGSVAEYDGSAFARNGVVCVTINYRLAAEGFLFLDDGDANLGPSRSSGSSALGAGQDQGVRR